MKGGQNFCKGWSTIMSMKHHDEWGSPCIASKARSWEVWDCFRQILHGTTAKEAGFLQEHFLLLFLVIWCLLYTLDHRLFFFFHELQSFYLIPSALAQRKLISKETGQLFLTFYYPEEVMEDSCHFWKQSVRLLPNFCLLSCKNILLTFCIKITCGITLYSNSVSHQWLIF